MRVGVCPGSIGRNQGPEFLPVFARSAEAAAFTTIWMGDHVVLFNDYGRSTYPYSALIGGRSPIPDPTTSMPDPLIAMTWAAASTSTIEVGTGVLILPQRNPLVLAKQLATLDVMSGGRVAFGAGLGWCREEYDAVGVPWTARGARMDEYLEAMRALWRQDQASYDGATVSFQDAYLFPKPVRGDLPILIGGESDAALARVARVGDGWLAFNLDVADAPERVAKLHELTSHAGRDPADLRIVVGVFTHTSDEDLRRYQEAGVTEFNLVLSAQSAFNATDPGPELERLSDRFASVVGTTGERRC